MAKRITQQSTPLQSWDDINQTLHKIARINATIKRATGEYELRKLDLDKQLEEQTAALLEQKKAHERNIDLFCQKHKGEFDANRTKQLFFGLVQLRWLPPRLAPLAKHTWEWVLMNLKKSGLTKYIRIKEEVDKEALKKLPEEKLLDLGLRLKQEEELYYEAYEKDLEGLD